MAPSQLLPDVKKYLLLPDVEMLVSTPLVLQDLHDSVIWVLLYCALGQYPNLWLLRERCKIICAFCLVVFHEETESLMWGKTISRAIQGSKRCLLQSPGRTVHKALHSPQHFLMATSGGSLPQGLPFLPAFISPRFTWLQSPKGCSGKNWGTVVLQWLQACSISCDKMC